MTTRRETDRRLHDLEQRIAWLDEHGTRGVQGLQIQLQEQGKDIAEATVGLAAVGSKIDALSANRLQQYVTIGLALLPVYVLLFLSLFHVTPVG